MADKEERRADETWEGTTRFDISEKTEWIFVPLGYPSLAGRWRTYLEEQSVLLWRFWWEEWLRRDCACCCCCNKHAETTSAPAPVPAATPRTSLAIDLHLVRLFTIMVGGAGRLPWEVHLGWNITGSTGQVTALLEYRTGGGQYRTVHSFQGTTVSDYMVQPPGGQFFYGPQTIWFRLTATDALGSVSQELPVNLP
jgi:hypothetical protein